MKLTIATIRMQHKYASAAEKNNYSLWKQCTHPEFGAMEKELKKTFETGCDWIHFDVEPRIFPAYTTGPLIVRSVRRMSRDYILDCTLPVQDQTTERIWDLINGGADIITLVMKNDSMQMDIHNFYRHMQMIKDAGCAVGVALKVNTPVVDLKYVIKLADVICIKSIDPGQNWWKKKDKTGFPKNY